MSIYSNPILYRLYLLFVKVKLKVNYLLHQGNLSVKKGDVVMKYNNDGDNQELLYLANWNKYYNEEFPKLKSLIKEGDTVIDVGSNIGFFALMMSKLVGKKGKVYCFEPSESIFSKLKENLTLNNITNVIAENKGLGEIEENKIIKRNRKYSGMSSIVLESDGELVDEKIIITSIDKYFSNIRESINLIKIDTEGYESQVLNGAVKTINLHRPIIYIELGGGKFLPSSKKAIKFLLDNNYAISIVEEDLEFLPAGTNFTVFPNHSKS
jgi:FkbM family methyltransferase